VVFGIRPEDIHDPRFLPPAISTAVIKSEVEVVEPMGSEIFVHLAVDGQSYIAVMDPRSRAAMGETMEVAITLDNIHLFDRQSQSAIR